VCALVRSVVCTVVLCVRSVVYVRSVVLLNVAQSHKLASRDVTSVSLYYFSVLFNYDVYNLILCLK